MTKFYAKDLPANGSPVQVECNGLLFQVRRIRSTQDGRKFTYAARQLPALNDFHGWWYRWSWPLMYADLQLMSKGETPE